MIKVSRSLGRPRCRGEAAGADGAGRDAAGLAARAPLRVIAARLGRAPSTVSREVRRNLSEPRKYRAFPAHIQAVARARRSRPRKLVAGTALRAEVAALLAAGYSPAQIAGRLRRDYPHRPGLQVSLASPSAS